MNEYLYKLALLGELRVRHQGIWEVEHRRDSGIIVTRGDTLAEAFQKQLDTLGEV